MVKQLGAVPRARRSKRAGAGPSWTPAQYARLRTCAPAVSPLLKDHVSQAIAFTACRHLSDVHRLCARFAAPCTAHHPEGFAWFFDEYVYVIVASGFRAVHAARLAPRLVDAAPQGRDALLACFKNTAKVDAIHGMYQVGQDPTAWRTFAEKALVGVDTLQEHVPRIGPTVKYHLGRNLGLTRHVAKPDVHMIRFAEEHGWQNVQHMCEEVLKHIDAAEWTRMLGPEAIQCVGVLDFCLWVFLSHDRGAKELECCNGGLRLR